MILYTLSANGTRDRGRCDLDRALAQFETCYAAGLAKYETFEEAIEKTGFGLARSDEDFIEVSCHGRYCVAIHSDRLHYPSSWLSRLFSNRHHLWIKGTRALAESVIQAYYELDREAFESRYSDYLVR